MSRPHWLLRDPELLERVKRIAARYRPMFGPGDILAHTEGPYVQESFRWRLDDDSETAATWLKAANVDIGVGSTGDVALDTNVRLRIVTTNAGDAASNGVLQQLQARVDQGEGFGAFFDVTPTSTFVVKSTLVGGPTDGDPTTEQIGGTGTFFSQANDSGSGSVMDDNANPSAFGEVGAGRFTETEWCIQFVGADLDDGDVVELRFTNDSGATLSYTVTPSVTISEVAGTTLTPDPAAAALSVATPAVQLGPVAVTPEPVAAAFSVPSPTLQMGAQSVTPDAISAAWTVTSPTIQLGTLGVTPDPVTAALSVPDPALQFGALSAEPDAVAAAWSVATPNVSTDSEQVATPDAVAAAWSQAAPALLLGELTILPGPVAGAWDVPDPDLQLGGLTVTPDAVAAAWAAISPTLELGNVLTPDAVAAVWAPRSVSVLLGEIALAPSPVAALWSVLAPTLDGGEPPDPPQTSQSPRRRVHRRAGLWRW
jgi:hypothetical protein